MHLETFTSTNILPQIYCQPYLVILEVYYMTMKYAKDYEVLL